MNTATQEKFITELEYIELQGVVESQRRINAQLAQGGLNRIKRIEKLEAELAKANQSIGHWGGKWGGEVLRRCEAEAERDALKAQLAEARMLIRDLTSTDDCRLDHHGYCQAHNWMATDCPHEHARLYLAQEGGDE